MRRYYSRNQERTPDPKIIEDARNEALNKSYNKKKFTQNNDLNKIRFGSLQQIKQNIIVENKQPRTINVYLCDLCLRPIISPQNGFVIHGTISKIGLPSGQILTPDNFPEGEFENSDNVAKTVYCKTCFCTHVLDIEPIPF